MTLGLPIVKSLKYLLAIGLVAAIYFVFGLLGLLFKVPPSNAGALWPPAGIALAAMLLLGRKIWPGVFLGNVCISVYAFGSDAQIAPVYFATGCGAAASAILGDYLIKRFIGFPTPLITDRSILQFMFFGGPLSSLLAPTVGIISMRLVGIIDDAEIPINWLSWWVGDTIGVLVFTPLVLTFFAQPQQIWEQRRTSVALPLLFTFVLVVGLFLYVRQIEQLQHHQQIKTQSITLSQAIKNRIQNDLNAINTLRLFFIGSSVVTNAEFDVFTEQSFSIFPEILSIRYASLDSIRQAKIDFSAQLNGVNRAANDNALFTKLNALLRAEAFEVNKDYLSFENGVAELLSAIYTENELQGIIFTKISIENLVANAL
ncbi:MAG: MASE1 domain-containing protein, partial [Methylococcales bacterium]